MSIIRIRTWGDPVLRTPAQPVTEFDRRLQTLVEDMIETMYDAPGVGIAAPQIGVSRRIACFDAQDDLGIRVMINPVLVETKGEWIYEEGCLSVPKHFWEITRPGWVRVQALDANGQEVEYSGDDLLARVILHEIDHLDGRLLIDRLDPALRNKFLLGSEANHSE